MSTQNLTQKPQARNGHTLAEAFTEAFVTLQTDNRIRTELLTRWSSSASQAVGALIGFRSALHRWQASGDVAAAEFMAEVQKLSDAGLLEWLDGNLNDLDLLHEVVTGGEA